MAHGAGFCVVWGTGTVYSRIVIEMLLCAMQIDLELVAPAIPPPYLAGKDVALKRWDNFMQKSDLYGIPGRRHAIRFMPFT